VRPGVSRPLRLALAALVALAALAAPSPGASGLVSADGPAPAPAAPPGSGPAPAPAVEPSPAAKVVAAIAKAAVENAARAPKERVVGDALLDLYVRRGASAAQGDVTAFLLGLAKAIDPSDTLGRFPLTAGAMRGLETDAEAKARRAAVGSPTLRGRDDRALHFVVSAAFAAQLGEPLANAAGLAKELADMRTAEEFSVGDLLADAAGVVFARRLRTGDPAANLAWAAASFVGADVVPDDAELADGLSTEAFEKAYGGPTDPRFTRMREGLFASVDALPYLRPVGSSGGGGGAGSAPTAPTPRPPPPRPDPRPTK